MKLLPYRQHSITLQLNQKLGLKYFGPFLVIECVGLVAYKLLLPPEAKIHLVFHISLLKKCVGDAASEYIPLPLLSIPEGVYFKLKQCYNFSTLSTMVTGFHRFWCIGVGLINLPRNNCIPLSLIFLTLTLQTESFLIGEAML